MGAKHVLVDGRRHTAARSMVVVVVDRRARHRRRVVARQTGTVRGHVVGHMMVVLVAMLVRVIGVGRCSRNGCGCH